MTENAFIYAPRAPHADSLSDPHLTIRAADGMLLAHYCPRHQCGGVYDLQAHAWSLYVPMTAEEFVGSLPTLGVHIGDIAALHTWIDAITAQQPSSRGH